MDRKNKRKEKSQKKNTENPSTEFYNSKTKKTYITEKEFEDQSLQIYNNLIQREHKNEVDEIILNDKNLNCFIHKITELKTYCNALSQDIEENIINNGCESPYYTSYIIENIFLTIYDAVLIINSPKECAIEFIQRKLNKCTLLSENLKLIIQSASVCIVKCLPSIIAFMSCFKEESWEKPEFSNCINICKLRSGIQFLDTFFRKTNISVPVFNGYKSHKFEEYYKIILKTSELKILDDYIREWKRDIHWVISCDSVPNINTDQHWWWKSAESSKSSIKDQGIPLMLSFSRNESLQLLSTDTTVTTVILFKKWWSSFNLFNWSLLYRLLLTLWFCSTGVTILIIEKWSVKKFEIMKLSDMIHALLVNIVISIVCVSLVSIKRFREIPENLYQNSSTNITKELNNITSFSESIKSNHIHYSWPYIFVISAYFSLIPLWIDPDLRKSEFGYVFPRLFTIFVINCVYYFCGLQFWIEYYLLLQEHPHIENVIKSVYKELNRPVFQTNKRKEKSLSQLNNSDLSRDISFDEAIIRNLKEIEKSYKDMLNIIKFADDHFNILINFFISFFAILGIYSQINQLYQLISHELTEKYVISIMMIHVYLGFFLYNSSYILEAKFTHLIDRFDNLSKKFNNAHKIVLRNYRSALKLRWFNESQNLKFRGIFRLNATFLDIAVIIQSMLFLTTIYQFMLLTPYHRPDNTNLNIV